MKFNTPLPQPLPKECQKAAHIFKSFVDSGNNGLDGVIPRSVLENAKGFAIFTVFKAGFLFSARAGSGIVIAKLEDGTWSAPSAIGSAGLGVGGQAGAEMTDFLVVLNSRSAVRSFMAAGSLTLGGNLSLAVGPLGRNGEAIGSLNTSGKVAAMYSYSKTRGLFGGVSIEGSVIVERQDTNAQAYRTDVTAKQLLSGAIPPPEWASSLIKTLESCTGLPGGRQWVQEFQDHHPNDPYMFGGVESPGLGNDPFDSRDFPESPSGGARTPTTGTPPIGNSASGKLSKKKKEKSSSISFPPLQWGRQKSSGSYFGDFHDPSRAPAPADAHAPSPKLSPEDRPSPRLDRVLDPSTGLFETRFQSDYISDDQLRQHPPLNRRTSAGRPSLTLGKGKDGGWDSKKTREDEHEWEPDSPFNDLPSGAFSEARANMSDATSHRRAFSAYAPSTSSAGPTRKSSNPFEAWAAREEETFDDDLLGGGRSAGTRDRDFEAYGKPRIAPKKELTRPLLPHEGVARAIALYDFKAVQAGDLSFSKGQVITVTVKSEDTNTWWTGKVDGREGMFPANFVEVV
ncbi:transporter [Ganoderma sinense ZZ0214-1]|uniref:Transporter n=1 Tax=Ganoderma sinense ZZ0214-1 TaxID=1077348 RepID=A0A2G8S1X6_9APHY|nr:transporter [Ganoderma sinense ZZ0214-1]